MLHLRKKALRGYKLRILLLYIRINYENNNWVIVDSNGTKQSLNGTWYLADVYTSITDQMIIRSGTVIMKANIVKSSINF